MATPIRNLDSGALPACDFAGGGDAQSRRHLTRARREDRPVAAAVRVRGSSGAFFCRRAAQRPSWRRTSACAAATTKSVFPQLSLARRQFPNLPRYAPMVDKLRHLQKQDGHRAAEGQSD